MKSAFLRPFTHVNFDGSTEEGALVKIEGNEVWFVHRFGWYRVNSQYIAYHDATVDALEALAEPDYEGLKPHNYKILARMDR